MDEILPGLWLGDFPSALDTETLKEKGIRSVLSAMRGRVTVHETFIRHQISLDDDPDADILVHFPPSIAFIGSELAKGRGVLVHCQAGISRSATIVAAYLMKTRNLNPQAALKMVRDTRPIISPNSGFLEQLEVFYEAFYTVSPEAPGVRRFYMERTVGQLRGSQTGGVTSMPEIRRRIRCKMCRRELATREHMLDHGQIGPSTPRPASPVTGGEIEPLSSLPKELQPTLVAPERSIHGNPAARSLAVAVPPILTDPRCSGLKWMDPFLSLGGLSGKIVCPNQRCKAKLGNYDWAGVGCGCGQWVTPGFCINRSKVDEVTVSEPQHLCRKGELFLRDPAESART
ncbi:dual specificity protein phosphatase 12 [Ephemerocybe angulata]|uniref:protein-tyrosine-phosphatase n=1 Tax=Ephemerocybe angulata TaxID=980116 RepID=A0A8H6HED0_9AGAR|nr:dual specificity protein phosphatase 12 [Tulosesus angulatus]